MTREAERHLQRLVRTLRPQQQTLDFDEAKPWEQLPAADRRVCRSAIAALLYQVTITTPDNDETQENDSDER
jgi:hypothetical protein